MSTYIAGNIAEELHELMDNHKEVLKDDSVYKEVGELLDDTCEHAKSLNHNSKISWLKESNDKLQHIYDTLQETANQEMRIDGECNNTAPKDVAEKQEERLEICQKVEEIHDHMMHTI